MSFYLANLGNYIVDLAGKKSSEKKEIGFNTDEIPLIVLVEGKKLKVALIMVPLSMRP